jgi:NAD(P)H-dependent flavin oxidoreductase YrpB (nitropropane dioxygenase family)
VFFWNLPSPAWIKKLKNSGAKIWVQVSAIDEAKAAINLGADAIIAQGEQAGGHNRSDLALSSIVPAIVGAISPAPVIAAGGIADGRTAAAALALGADAVCVGTRLIASNEAYAHEEYKRRVVKASAFETAKTKIFGPEWPDEPIRVLRNRVVDEWAGKDYTTAPQTTMIGKTVLGGHEYAMPKFSAALPTPDTTGDFEEMCMPAGESAGLVHAIKPAGEIVREIMDEAAKAIETLGRLTT